MSHANARLTPAGRLRLAQLVVDQQWPLRRAAERWNCSVTTARRWAQRYRAGGRAALVDRSSRPHVSARRTPQRKERRVLGLRVSRRWGPARIASHLRMPVSTVWKILRRYRCPRLSWTDPMSGIRIKTSRAKARSYVFDEPGGMIHVDIKKLGRIPDGGGWRSVGKSQGEKNTRRGKMGYWHIHNAVDDHSRLAYSEILADEKQETAAAFWERARIFFEQAGMSVQRVMTDNGACYRSKKFAAALGKDITHKRTRPYRPQTNGKVERFNRTMLEEWAYSRHFSSEADRVACFEEWIHTYNHHRGHTALGGKAPADFVPNLRGQNS